MGIEPTRDIRIPHVGFEDRGEHQYLSCSHSEWLRNYFIIPRIQYSEVLGRMEITFSHPAHRKPEWLS